MTNKPTPVSIRALFSLASLYLAVTIGWIAYYNYQPKLLTLYKLQSLKEFLYISQGIILVITPIIAGVMGDRQRKKGIGRLPLISAGIAFAAMIFMSVAFSLLVLPDHLITTLLPILIVLWIFAMSLFTSPAISTIDLLSPKIELTTSMSVIALIFGVVYALEPVVIKIVDTVGAVLTFVLGGVLVLVSGFLLRRNMKGIPDIIEQVNPRKSEKSNYFTPLLLGIGAGIITTLIFNKVPAWVDAKHLPLNGGIIASVILGLSAVFAIPVGMRIAKVFKGIMTYYLAGLAMCVIALIGIEMSHSTLAVSFLVIVVSASYALVFVIALPLSTRFISYEHRVLGVGLFFSGMEIPNSILEYLLIAH